MAKIQDIDIPHLEFAEAAAPATPASGIVRIYAKTDGILYQKDDAGTETALANTAGNTLSVTKVYRATNQNVSGSGTFTAISWSNEVEDDDGAWAIGTPTKFVIPAGLNGRRAIIRAQVNWTDSTGGNYRGAYLFKGGTGGTLVGASLWPDVATTVGPYQQVFSEILTLATSEEFELYIRADTTGIGAIGGAGITWMELMTID